MPERQQSQDSLRLGQREMAISTNGANVQRGSAERDRGASLYRKSPKKAGER